jgi:hypothetical protein
MKEIAGRLASVIAAFNTTIGFIAATAITAVIAYWATYVLFYPNGINRWWDLLAIPAFLILPTLAAIIVQLPLWLVTYVLAGSINVRAIRLQHKLVGFIDTHERLYGRRPSEEEIESLANQINQSRVRRSKAAMWIALCVQGAALVVAGVAGYNGAAQDIAFARSLARPQTQTGSTGSVADSPTATTSEQPRWMTDMNANPKFHTSTADAAYFFCAKTFDWSNEFTQFIPRAKDCLDYYGAAAFAPSQKTGD